MISNSWSQKLELVTQSGHSDSVWVCSFSPDGRFLASGSIDGTVKLWDVKTGKELKTFYGSSESIVSLCFNADGTMLAGGSSCGTITLWSVTDGTVISEIKKPDTVIECLSFSHDGKLLACGGHKNGVINILDTETCKEVFTIAGHSKTVLSLKFFRKEKKLASAGKDGTIRLWDLNNRGKEISVFHVDAPVYSISLTSDEKYLACGSEDKKVTLWDMSSGEKVFSLSGHSEPVLSVSFSPGGKMLASAGQDKKIILWDRLGGREIFKVESFPYPVESVCFSPDGMILAIACDDNMVRLWDISTIDPRGDINSQIRHLTGKSSYISSVTFSPDGKILASIIKRYIFNPDYNISGKYKYGKEKSSVMLWDLETGKALPPLEKTDEHFQDPYTETGALTESIVFSHSGNILACASSSSVKLWDIKTGKLLKTIEDKEHYITSVAFTGDDRIATACTNTVKIHDPGRNNISLIVKDFPGIVKSLSFGNNLMAAGMMRNEIFSKNRTTISLRDIKTGEEIHNIETGDKKEVNTFLTFSRDGKFLAAGSDDRRVILWETDRWNEILQIEGLPPVSFSSDGKILACSDVNNGIKLLDVATGKEILTMKGHSKKINSISWSQSGKILATGGDDMKIKLWHTISGKEAGTIISIDENDWAVIQEDCRFDATAKGMKSIHFVIKNMPVMLFQLKNCYYEPGLLAKITGFNSEPFREIISLKDLNIFPDIKVELPGKDKKLTVKLFDQGGGIGKVQIYLNNIEIGTSEGKNIINIDLSNVSFLQDGTNIITVTAWNREGYLSNGGIEFPWIISDEQRL
ncbi:MAG: hypothetical protein ABRQ39_02190 [Candidatus Eremiobacterota bacterium]